MKRNLSKTLRIIGRISGIIGTIIFVIFLLIALFGRYPAGRGTFDIIFIAVILAIALFGSIYSWWRLEIAGVTLIGACVLMWIVSVFAYGLRDSLNWLQAGLPILLAGLLFILSAWLSDKLILFKRHKSANA